MCIKDRSYNLRVWPKSVSIVTISAGVTHEMKTAKRNIGDIGESVTVRYLEKRGDIVVDRNYWKPWGEIDIVAKRQDKLVFVEVKSVSHGTIRPEENMHPEKLKRLHRAIQSYLGDHKISEGIEWQIDLACVHLDIEKKEAKVDLLENIVL